MPRPASDDPRPRLGTKSHRIRRRVDAEWRELSDRLRARIIASQDRWPCPDAKYLLVGAESSGTTALADLLFEEVRSIRFLVEGGRQAWVWDAYQRVYAGQATIRDFPRLQLFDAIKVPGFAMIIEQFKAEFPATTVVYVVRDPRDFVSSAIRTWASRGVSDLSEIPWVAEDWLGLPSEDPLERLCLRWCSYLRTAEKADDVIFIRYEDFCDDKVETIRVLAGRLGLPFNEQRVMDRKDLQISRARKYAPRGPGSWNGELSPEQVRRIEHHCADEMERWGYAASANGVET